MLVRCAQLSIKAQRLVIAIWILLTVAGVLGAINLDKHLTTSLEIPGSASAAASQVLNKEFAENTEGTFTVMNKYGQATPDQIAGFKGALATAVSVIPETCQLMALSVGTCGIQTPHNRRSVLSTSPIQNGIDFLMLK
jgi:hypothetical protein